MSFWILKVSGTLCQLAPLLTYKDTRDQPSIFHVFSSFLLFRESLQVFPFHPCGPNNDVDSRYPLFPQQALCQRLSTLDKKYNYHLLTEPLAGTLPILNFVYASQPMRSGSNSFYRRNRLRESLPPKFQNGERIQGCLPLQLFSTGPHCLLASLQPPRCPFVRLFLFSPSPSLSWAPEAAKGTSEYPGCSGDPHSDLTPCTLPLQHILSNVVPYSLPHFSISMPSSPPLSCISGSPSFCTFSYLLP